MATFWRFGADYGRRPWFLVAWFMIATLLFGSIYSFTDLFFFEKVSSLSGYIHAALVMIPFGYVSVLPNGWVGEILILSQSLLGYILLILIGMMLVNKIRY